MRTTATPERLREVLTYDAETGDFFWLVATAQRVRVGDVAGGIHPSGYRQIVVDGRLYMAHRLAWFYIYGAWPTNQIDHINGDRADNRLANLREATNAENSQNQRHPSANNQSGFLGVSKDRSRWKARIMVGGRHRHLGYFDSPEEAHTRYLEAKATLHPFWEH